MDVSGLLHLQGRIPRYSLDRGLGGPRAGLDAVVKRRIPSPSRDSSSLSSSPYSSEEKNFQLLQELEPRSSSPEHSAEKNYQRVSGLEPPIIHSVSQ
jgi:hypothetical protein